jgi:hypothetical protein
LLRLYKKATEDPKPFLPIDQIKSLFFVSKFSLST